MKRVLVIDDSTTIRIYHRQLLEEIGCEVDEAQNGVEALEKALTNPYDLFLVDVNMPKMDGYRFLQEVRRNPEIRHIPAMMVSTEAMAWDREKAFEAGANFYNCKPVRPETLQQYVILMAGVTDS